MLRCCLLFATRKQFCECRLDTSLSRDDNNTHQGPNRSLCMEAPNATSLWIPFFVLQTCSQSRNMHASMPPCCPSSYALLNQLLPRLVDLRLNIVLAFAKVVNIPLQCLSLQTSLFACLKLSPLLEPTTNKPTTKVRSHFLLIMFSSILVLGIVSKS